MLQQSDCEFLFEIPPVRTGHVAVSYDKCVLVWGGYKENPGAQASTYYSGSEIWIYSCVSERWYLKESLDTIHPPGMSGSTAVIIDDSLYLFGGYGYRGEGCTNRLYKLELTTFAWELLKPTGTPPIPVDKMVGWQYKNKFYVFGGFGNPESGPPHDFQFIFYHLLWRGWTNQFFEYDPKKNKWSVPATTGTLPSARAAHAAAVVQEKVYIFGGRHDVFRLNDMHCLDMKTMQWSGNLSMKGTVPVGRSWHSLTALDDQHLVLYGGFSQNNAALSDCWLFDTFSLTWRQMILPFDKPRLWHCACLNVFDEILIYGGCISNILDLERTPEQATDIIIISISPKSLFRLCLDRMLDLPEYCKLWYTLPRHIQTILHLRIGYTPRKFGRS